MVKALPLHEANLGSILSSMYGPHALLEVIPEHEAKSNIRAFLGMAQNKKLTKSI